MNLKKFYLRRIFRIWPLYYFILIIGLFVLRKLNLYELTPEELQNNEYSEINILLLFAILPNVSLVLYGGLPFLHQLWSIGSEEQFYLFWPIIINKSKKIFVTLFWVMLAYFAIKVVFYFLRDEKGLFNALYSIWGTFCIDTMAIGGVLGAFFYFKKEKILNFIYSKYTQIITYLLLLFSYLFSRYIPSLIKYEVISVLFSMVVLNLGCNPKSLIKLENKFLNYLGKISFSIYMVHPITISIAFYILRGVTNSNLINYFTAILFTIITAIITYELYEKPFITMKNKWFSFNGVIK